VVWRLKTVSARLALQPRRRRHALHRPPAASRESRAARRATSFAPRSPCLRISSGKSRIRPLVATTESELWRGQKEKRRRQRARAPGQFSAAKSFPDEFHDEDPKHRAPVE